MLVREIACLLAFAGFVGERWLWVDGCEMRDELPPLQYYNCEGWTKKGLERAVDWFLFRLTGRQSYYFVSWDTVVMVASD